MADNVLQTLQQLVQDVIAPDVRELKVRVSSLEKQMDVRFDAMEKKTDARFFALEQKIDSQFLALLAAIGESKAQAEIITMRLIAPLAERIAVPEAQRR